MRKQNNFYKTLYFHLIIHSHFFLTVNFVIVIYFQYSDRSDNQLGIGPSVVYLWCFYFYLFIYDLIPTWVVHRSGRSYEANRALMINDIRIGNHEPPRRSVQFGNVRLYIPQPVDNLKYIRMKLRLKRSLLDFL